MPPTITFVRHAQGFHNLSIANHAMHDPLLTPHGKHQCADLQNNFPHAHSIDLIVASPIKRTVYTALLSFSHTIAKKNLTVIGLPELQETSDLPCDTGSSRAVLEEEFAGQPVDLSLVVDGWNSKTGRWAADTEAIEARCRVARQWLMQRPEKHIVVVTHGGVLHYLTEDWEDMNKYLGTGWANTEYRSYTFDPTSTTNATLVETAESRHRRKGTRIPLADAEPRSNKMTPSHTDHAQLEGKRSRKSSVEQKPHPADGVRIMEKLRQKQNERDFVGGF